MPADEWTKAIIDQFPPLTEQQKITILRVFRGAGEKPATEGFTSYQPTRYGPDEHQSEAIQ